MSDPVLAGLEHEVDRAVRAYAAEPHPPYFLGLRVTELADAAWVATEGAVRGERSRTRTLIVDARVGSHELDNSRRTARVEDDEPTPHPLPIEDDELAVRAGAWSAIERAVVSARSRYLRVAAEHGVRAPEPDDADDLSREAPVVALGPRLALPELPAGWDTILARASDRLAADPRVQRSSATLRAEGRVTWVVTSDGTRVRESRVVLVVVLQAAAMAADGMDVVLGWRRVFHDGGSLPSEQGLLEHAARLADDVLRVREASLGEPYAGPVLLEGPAAGVWLHEVIGHRAEGHRNKDGADGQTFRGHVGARLLPEHVDIWDDPRVRELAGEALYGCYDHDDEGRPAERVDLVQGGVWRSFLMGRSPIPGFPRSNGHARGDDGSLVVARMSNTVLETRAPTPVAELRTRLMEEARRQGLPWALRVEDLAGGHTLTGRLLPNAFVLTAWRAYRVFCDGRPDELVRGLDLSGTPLVCLAGLLAAGDDPAVFVGECAAESGVLPVTATSPSLLFARMEAQRRHHRRDAPPPPGPPGVADTVEATLASTLEAARAVLASDAHLVAFTWREVRSVDARAEHGALLVDEDQPDARLTAEVRLGTPEADNGGAEIPAGFGRSKRLPAAPSAVAAEAWRRVWSTHKHATRALAARVARRQLRPGGTEPADFAPADPVRASARPAERPSAERARSLARGLSARVRDLPEVVDHRVTVRAVGGRRLRLDTRGVRVDVPVACACVEVRLTGRAFDGQQVELAHERVAASLDRFDVASLSAEVDALGAWISTWSRLPRATSEHFGPVLFEGAAAVELFLRLLPGFGGSRRRVEGGGDDVIPQLRLGRRVLPPGFRVVDDPTGDLSSPSGYALDDEGVPAERVVLVEDGRVRSLYTSCMPGPGVPRSNGHGRGGGRGRAVGMPAQVSVEPPEGFPEVSEVCGPVVIVRRFDAVDGAAVPGCVSRAPDGTEAPLRGLRLCAEEALLYRVLAVGPRTRATVLTCRRRYDHAGDREDVPVTLEVPAVLVDDVLLEPDPSPGTPAGPVPRPRAGDAR